MQQFTTQPIIQNKEPFSSPELDEDSIDLRALIMKVWQGKWIIAICAIICVVLAILSFSQVTPMYKAAAKVMFVNSNSNVVDIQQLLTENEFSKDTLQNEIEVLKSTSLIRRVVNKLRLEQNPEFNPNLRVKKETLLERFNTKFELPDEVISFLQDMGLMTPPALPLDPAVVTSRMQRAVVENVRKGLRLTPVRGSRVIQIAFLSQNPNTAVSIVNSIAEQYIVDQLEAKLDATRSATGWLSSRVDDLREKVRNAEGAVEAKRAQLLLDSGQSLAITKRQLEAITTSLSLAQNASAQAASKYDRLNKAILNQSDLGTVPEFRDSPLLQANRAAEAKLISSEKTLAKTVSNQHPTLQRVRDQISDLRTNAREEAQRIVESMKVKMNASMKDEEALTVNVRSLEQMALSQSSAEIELRQLERETQASRILYENFLGRLKETSDQEDLQNANARVLSAAEEPPGPESQRKKITVLLSAIVGAGIGVGIIFLLDALNNTFRGPQQVEDTTGVNVLATIPVVGSRVRRADVLKQLREKPSGSLAESVRNLRTSILFSNLDDPPKVILFTSSIPREGKSTTSMLMALTSQQMGKSAVIVDCDLRLPALAGMLNAKDESLGLLSLMEGTVSLEEAMYHDPITGLHVLMSRPGERPTQLNAADILSSNRFKALIQQLSQRYDLVILDTPPTVVVSDARIVSNIADGVVYVIRWDKTPRGAVMEGLKSLNAVNAKILGITLTMVNEKRAAKYSYDGYGYYKGKYNDYYIE